MNRCNIFKAGKILQGLIQYSLDNVWMTTDVEPPYTHTRITKIYNLKPLRNAHILRPRVQT